MDTNKYQNGKIYKIVCDTLNLTYYGSTIQSTIARRLTGHIRSYKHYQNEKGPYTTSFELFENNNYNIFLVENFPCNSKDELLSRERFYIENNECVNKCIPTRTDKEWKESNKEHIKEFDKEWREANKEYIKEKSKKWREANKEYIKEKAKEWREANKERVNEKNKEWREANKEYRKKYNKEYYEANKETPTNK
jgi:hypothetical protein